MAEISFTKEQQSAISSRGGDILVSAAAGSGKTAVLTQRVIERLIFDEETVPADRLMIVTFTRASAAEMKARIMKKLSALLIKEPENIFLRRQITLFERTRIGTIHSCCVEILRDNFSLLGLPSDFRLGETDEIKKIENTAVSTVLEERFKKNSHVFISLANLFGGRRDNKDFCAAILKILNFARSVPFYRDWLKDMPSRYAMPVAPGSTEWEKLVFENAFVNYSTAISFFNSAINFCDETPDLEPYADTIKEDISVLKELKGYILSRDLTSAFNFLKVFKFAALKPAKKADIDDKEYVKALREAGKERIKDIGEKLILSTYEEFCSDLSYFKPLVDELFNIALDTDALIFSEKMKAKVIDFSDLEQLSLKLLLKKEEDGSFTKTEAARKLSSEIDEIMIDEYQDVNEVQDAILKALSNDKNRFMVGDVKQSIYRFRQACPALFINMLSEFHPEEENLYPKKILLNGNFRTAEEITTFINFIFGNIMTRFTGEINYLEGHELNPMRKDKENFSSPVEIVITEKMGELSSSEAEAAVAARKIKELLNSDIEIGQGENRRKLLPSDIAILMRNPKNKAHIYEKALEKVGIKSSALKDDDFLTSFEIKPMVNLLEAVCNPVKSMELSGAMLSPIFGFTDEDLAEIKLKHPAKNLYSQLSACEEGTEAFEFKKYFDSLIAFSKTNTPSALINKIYYDTGYKTLISAMENGEYMEERLSMLLIYAENLKERGASGLNAFLKALEAMKDNSVSFTSKAAGKSSDAVTITSIHSSKGLEWPVVFLSETASNFSFTRNELIDPYILNKDLGFASLRRDDVLKIQFPTVPLAAARSLTQKLSLAEEMRLLYVAMTRAKDKLVITSSVSNFDKKLMDNSGDFEDDIYENIVYSKKSYIDWILTGLKLLSPEDANNLTLAELYYLPPFEKEAENVKEEVVKAPSSEKIKAEIEKRLSFIYPFEEASKIPSKIAASQLSGNLRSAYAFSKKPEFAKGGKEGSKRGNAFHKFMQLCSFSSAKEDAEKEAEKLLKLNLMTEDEISLLSFTKIENLLKGKIGELIFSSDKLLREYRFFAPASVSPISRELCDDKGNSAMLEGVADLIAIKDRKLYIIDYKTDRVSNEEELRELYKNQVLLYKDMLKYSFTMPVERVFLYSFHLEKEISI